MQLTIGQKVAYPNQGVCLVEGIKKRDFGDEPMRFYSLRVLSDNSTIFVPKDNAESVGIRPIINSQQCKKLIGQLADDFEHVSGDWKSRAREFTEKLHSSDIFEVADVFKKLMYLSQEKKLSFREQTLLEKAKFLIVSEIAYADSQRKTPGESEIMAMVENACMNHVPEPPKAKAKGKAKQASAH